MRAFFDPGEILWIRTARGSSELCPTRTDQKQWGVPPSRLWQDRGDAIALPFPLRRRGDSTERCIRTHELRLLGADQCRRRVSRQ